jgi:hypothetical protein
MIVTDLRLIETGNGGDLVLKGNDLQMIQGWQNMPYLGLFGGNPKESTKGPKVTEQVFDFWGNYLFNPSIQELWYNSGSERLLQELPLTTASRIQIEEQVKKDLEFMKQFAIVAVNVILFEVDKLKINIQITEPTSNEINNFTYIWNATEQELTDQSIGNQNGAGVGLNVDLNFDL